MRSSGIAASLNGLRPAQVARHNASATLGWQGASLTARYVGPQFEDDQNLRRLRSAVTLDGALNLPLTRGLGLSLRAENITNTRIEAGISATGVIERASPRTFWLGLRWADKR